MRSNFLLFSSIVLFSVVFAAAQDSFCGAPKASVIGRQTGVVAQEVTLSGAWGSNTATVFLPDKEIAEGAVILSHSAIQSAGGTTDLLPFALTLARAGAAVIVPERTLVWPPKNATMNREGAAVICAARWIVDNAKLVNGGVPVTNEQHFLIRWGYAYVGPTLCDPNASDCRLTSPLISEPGTGKYHRVTFCVPVGETEGGDNTAEIISDRGLFAAQAIQRHLRLLPITTIVTVPLPSDGS